MSVVSNQKAFTLIELMITVVVIGIVIAFAAPQFGRSATNNKSVAIADEFTAALNFARAEALKRNNFVTLCPRNDDDTACGTDWSKGWLVVRDTAASDTTTPVVANSDAILRIFDLSTKVSQYSFDPARDYVRFGPLGVLGRDKGSDIVSVTLSVSHCTGDAARQVTVSLSGMVRVVKKSCS